MPGNRGIAGLMDSKSMERSGYFRFSNSFPNPGPYHGCPVCTLVHARTPLNLTQFKVFRDVADTLDAHLFQFLHRAGIYSRQVADVVIRSRGIAAVVELTGNGICAMATGSDLRSRWHGDGAQLSQKLGCQLVIQFCNLPIEV